MAKSWTTTKFNVIRRHAFEMPRLIMPDLSAMAELATRAARKGPPPVHLWNPPFCGAIDMRIAADGTWYYQGTPIGRPAMVRLFASILRKDPGRFVLVTPVEMVEIAVEDAPFLAVAMEKSGEPGEPALLFRTNVDDEVTADADHPLRFEREATGGFRPYLLVRGGLWARATRSVYLELVDLAEIHDVGGVAMLGVSSCGTFFPVTAASEIGDFAC